MPVVIQHRAEFKEWAIHSCPLGIERPDESMTVEGEVGNTWFATSQYSELLDDITYCPWCAEKLEIPTEDPSRG